MKMVGVYVDISNLYKIINLKTKGLKLDYKKYLDGAIGEDDILFQAIAYGVCMKNEADKFKSCLRHYGYTVKYKKQQVTDGVPKHTSWDLGMALDIVRDIPKLDIVVLGTSSPAMIDLIKWIQEQDTAVIVVSCGIPKEIKQAAEWKEIPDDYFGNT